MISARAEIERMVAVATASSPNPAIQNLIQRPGTVDEIIKGDPSAFLNEVRSQISPELRSVMLPTLAPPSEADINVAATTVAAVTEGARGSIEGLLRALLVLRGIDNPAGELFESLLPSLEISAENVPRVLKLAQGIQIQMKMPPEAPQHERDWAEAFHKALASRDYHGIVDFLDKLDRGRGILMHPLAEYFMALSAKTAPSELASHLDGRTGMDVLVIHACLQTLPFHLLVEVASRSHDFLVKLHALELVSRGRGRPASGFVAESLSNLIQTIPGDDEGWRQMCAHFGRFPSRYPLLWFPLGRALQGVAADEIALLVRSFSPGDMLQNDDEAREILNGLLSTGCSNTSLAIFLEESFRVWRQRLHSRLKKLEPATTIARATFQCAVTEFFQRKGVPWLRRRIQRLLANLRESENRWFASSTEFVAHRVLFATYLSPSLEAYQRVKAAGDAAFETEAGEVLQQQYDFGCFGIWQEGPAYYAWARNHLFNALNPSSRVFKYQDIKEFAEGFAKRSEDATGGGS